MGMKWLKWITVALLAAFVALFVYQNLATFDGLTAFSLDLYVRELGWSHHLYTIIGIAALLGFVLGVLLMLKPLVKTRRLLMAARQERAELLEKLPRQEPSRAAEQPQAPVPTREPSVADVQTLSGNPGADAAAADEPPPHRPEFS
jgi:hypothetical protein